MKKVSTVGGKAEQEFILLASASDEPSVRQEVSEEVTCHSGNSEHNQ
jgi:hypothetical protein